MNLNYNEIIEECDKYISYLNDNALNEFFEKVKPELRSSIVQFIRKDLKFGDRIFEYLTEVPDALFKGIDDLPQKMYLNCTKIGENAFEDSNIGVIIIASNIQSVGDEAFKNCKSLRQVSFKNGSFEALGEHAFEGCENLIAVLLPNSIYRIDKEDFESCEKVKIAVNKGVRYKLSFPGQIANKPDSPEYKALENWYNMHVGDYTPKTPASTSATPTAFATSSQSNSQPSAPLEK